MDCDRFANALQELLDGSLPEEKRPEVEGHLRSCKRCNELYADLKRLRSLLRSLPDLKVSTEFTRNVKEIIEAERRRAFRNKFLLRAAALVLGAVSLSVVLILALRRPAGPREVAGVFTKKQHPPKLQKTEGLGSEEKEKEKEKGPAEPVVRKIQASRPARAPKPPARTLLRVERAAPEGAAPLSRPVGRGKDMLKAAEKAKVSAEVLAGTPAWADKSLETKGAAGVGVSPVEYLFLQDTPQTRALLARMGIKGPPGARAFKVELPREAFGKLQAIAVAIGKTPEPQLAKEKVRAHARRGGAAVRSVRKSAGARALVEKRKETEQYVKVMILLVPSPEKAPSGFYKPPSGGRSRESKAAQEKPAQKPAGKNQRP